MPSFYTFNRDGADNGPLTLDELRNQITSGVIPSNKLTRTTDSKDWKPASTFLPDLAGFMHRQIASERLIIRYKDVYSVAAILAFFSSLVKVLGFIIGFAAAGVCHRLFTKQISLDINESVFIAIIIFLIVLIPFYALGILIGAVGALLRAGADTAVNTSPVLTNEQKVSAIFQ